MFEAAQWLQREFESLVVLPIREETYDNHHNEPPLDTALKDLVFRIEPPLFQRVLQNRITLALDAIRSKGPRIFRYNLPNGMQVEYPASDQAFYLSSIMRSIFEHDRYVRRFIVGLSGRNIRRALEIFLQFCTSGHISEAEILKIRQSQGQYVLPVELVTTVLLRLNQRYYSSKGAYLNNLYAIDEHDERPNFFTRIIILKLLQGSRDIDGPKRLKGYLTVGDIRAKLETFGVARSVFFREIEILAKAFCIYSEDFSVEALGDSDLIALAPAGVVHLQIVDNHYYLSAVAEDTWFKKEDTARQISYRIRDQKNQYSQTTTFYNAVDVFNYITDLRATALESYAATFESSEFETLTDLSNAHSNLLRFERSIASGAWIGLRERNPIGSICTGIIAANNKSGIFVEIASGPTGLIPASNLPNGYDKNREMSKRKKIRVRVVDINPQQQRLLLELAPK